MSARLNRGVLPPFLLPPFIPTVLQFVTDGLAGADAVTNLMLVNSVPEVH